MALDINIKTSYEISTLHCQNYLNYFIIHDVKKGCLLGGRT